MARNHYDQASRYAAKLDPTGFLGWILRLSPDRLHFCGWLDTRTLPFPGESDRICDTVAHLEDPRRTAQPWAVPVEFELTARGEMFGRLLVYLGQLWEELRLSGERGSRFHVAAIVVNLTGEGASSRSLAWPEAGLRTELLIAERNLGQEDAGDTLARIADGIVARCALPWIPLMQRGGESAMIDQWRVLAGAETDSKRRGDYAGLALVFAEAAGRRAVWKEALKEWTMVQSQQVLEWMAEGEVKGRRAALLEVLALKFGDVPAVLQQEVRANMDPTRLSEWMAAAVAADSVDAFKRITGL